MPSAGKNGVQWSKVVDLLPTSNHSKILLSAEELAIWLHPYNWHRPHGGIKSQIPISRLGLSKNNLLRLPHLERSQEIQKILLLVLL